MAQTPVEVPFDVIDDTSARVFSAAYMMVTGLMGESTARHFASHALPLPASALLGGTLLLAVAATYATRAR